MRYFGFAIADSMFPGVGCLIRKTPILMLERDILEGVVPVINPSHTATIKAMRVKYGFDVPIPETPPQVTLFPGDSIIVMGVRGLPRLTDRHEYTEEEVAKATFAFSLYEVVRYSTKGDIE
jgi:hypothetical protein